MGKMLEAKTKTHHNMPDQTNVIRFCQISQKKLITELSRRMDKTARVQKTGEWNISIRPAAYTAV
jgi:hypothetical protein